VTRGSKLVLGLVGVAVVASSILQFRHRAAARAVEATALSSLQSIIDGKDVLQGSTTDPYPKVDELVRRTLTGQPTVTSSGFGRATLPGLQTCMFTRVAKAATHSNRASDRCLASRRNRRHER
jgi:hypothetical protein